MSPGVAQVPPLPRALALARGTPRSPHVYHRMPSPHATACHHRMCITQRVEWDGLLLGSDHEELLAMTVADL